MFIIIICRVKNLSFFPTTTMQPISAADRASIISLLGNGYSLRKIEAKTGLSKSTIARVSKEVYPDKENLKGGRSSLLSTCDCQAIIRQITSSKLDNAVQATKYINNTRTNPVSTQTVRNSLKTEDFCAVIKKKRPLLKKAHRIARLKFARYHQNWTVEDWKRVLWSDETKINRIGSDGRSYVWKKKGEGLSDRTTTPTVKHGGGNNLMVWGSMGWEGVGMLVEVEGIMDATQYCSILDHAVEESFEKLEMKEGERIFQQDNDPKHTSKMATKWFEDNNIEVLNWPAQSPDINPIEHLWVHLKKQLNKYENPPKGVFELWERTEEEWNDIPAEACQRLIESMPRRIEAVIKAKGGHTKY